jgi:hypothetical protein
MYACTADEIVLNLVVHTVTTVLPTVQCNSLFKKHLTYVQIIVGLQSQCPTLHRLSESGPTLHKLLSRDLFENKITNCWQKGARIPTMLLTAKVTYCRRVMSEWERKISAEILTGEAKMFGGKPVPVPLFPPQIPNGLALVRTRSSATTG